MWAVVEVGLEVRGVVEPDSLPDETGTPGMLRALCLALRSGAKGFTLAVPAHRMREYLHRYGTSYAGHAITYLASDSRNPSPGATALRAVKAAHKAGHDKVLLMANNCTWPVSAELNTTDGVTYAVLDERGHALLKSASLELAPYAGDNLSVCALLGKLGLVTEDPGPLIGRAL